MPGPDAEIAKSSSSDDGGLGIMPAPARRLADLREELKRRKLDGFIVPRTDEFMGEYMAPYAERVQWLTGFAGSAGLVMVSREEAAIFIDGRYTLQVRDQVDTETFTPRHITEEPPGAWIEETFTTGSRIGYDPWLHTLRGIRAFRQSVEKVGGTLVPVETNPVDAIWSGQPGRPDAPIHPHSVEFAGESSTDKRARLGKALADNSVTAAVVTMSDSIAWLLNIRGGDVPNCPLALSFAILYSDGRVDWFVDEEKLTSEAREALDSNITIEAPGRFKAVLKAIGNGGARVQADPASAAEAIFDHLKAGGAEIVHGEDPCLLPKACKNATEIEGAREAHHRDGAALCRFLHWIDENAASGDLTELDAIDHLYGLRREDNNFHGPSFDTIAGAGPNGAIVHYRASPETNRRIERGTLLLVDSGGQYDQGTTDVTRTVAIGTPTEEMRRRFTQVLKGHIALATARFPKGVTGSQLDPMARAALWADGVDYDHGTGHGVGSYLNVHEGPQRISKTNSPVALEPGMIVSNEPGFYKTGEYGIRIENLVTVVPVEEPPQGSEKELRAFETLTLAPIDRNLIDADLLNQAERFWLDAYHARILEEIGPRVPEETRRWLEKACAPLQM